MDKTYKLKLETEMRVYFNSPVRNISSLYTQIPQNTVVTLWDENGNRYIEQNEYHPNIFTPFFI